MIKVSNKRPPEWILKKANEMFDVVFESGVVFTYDDEIFTYSGEISEDLYIHELHHCAQQYKYGSVEEWWKKYFDNVEFRLTQELECYRKQYRWIKENLKNREEINRLLFHYAKCLSGKMYGNLITMNEALKLIKQ